MPVDTGDNKYESGKSVTLPSGSNDVSGGDAVTFDGSGNVTTTTSNSDDLVGVVLPENTGDDDYVTVHVAGLPVAVDIDGSVSAGDTLVPSGTTNGRFESHVGGMYNPNPDSGGDAVAANHPFALEDGSDGDTIVAVFR